MRSENEGANLMKLVFDGLNNYDRLDVLLQESELWTLTSAVRALTIGN